MRYLPYFAIVLLASCATARAGPSSPPMPVVEVGQSPPTPPASILGYSLETTRDYDLNGGSMYRYDGGGIYFDVFIYPIPFSDLSCDSACRWGAVDAEVNGFIQSFPLLIERGYLAKINLTIDTERSLGGQDERRVRYVEAQVVNDRNEKGTTIYILYEVPTYFVKIRVTDFSTVTGSDQILAFASETSRLVSPPFRCALGPAAVEPISVATTLPSDTTRVANAVVTALTHLGYELAYAAEGWYTTRPRFTWLPTFEGGDLVERPHPGVQVTIGARPVQDSTSVSVVARAACDLGAFGEFKGSRVETLVGMTSALEVMHEVTKQLDTSREQ